VKAPISTVLGPSSLDCLLPREKQPDSGVLGAGSVGWKGWFSVIYVNSVILLRTLFMNSVPEEVRVTIRSSRDDLCSDLMPKILSR